MKDRHITDYCWTSQPDVVAVSEPKVWDYGVFSSQGILWYISYLYSIPLQKLGFFLIGSRGIIWNQLQTIPHCENKTCFRWNWKWKLFINWKLFWLVGRQLQSYVTSVEVRYHYSLTCEDKMIEEVNFLCLFRIIKVTIPVLVQT